MWIKHDNGLYNTNDMGEVTLNGTQIRAKFISNSETKIIGQFRTKDEASSIFQSIVRSLLFEDSGHPGMIIKDTKKVGKKDEKN